MSNSQSENGEWRVASSTEGAGKNKLIAISERQNELLKKKGTMKPSASDTCTLQSVHPVSTSSPKSLTADQDQTDPVIISTQSTVLSIS